MEHGAACLAAMSLRSPTNSAKIVECGAIEVLVRCMRSHSDKSSMQRQGQCNPHHITSHQLTVHTPIQSFTFMTFG
jgi:Armadillo/beta-catenin-like repeat